MEQNAPVGGGPSAVYPDVVLTSPDRGRKIEQIIEVETVESVNNLESLAEWVPFGRLRPAFHLYVPAAMADVAKRLCSDSNIPVSEIHSYHWVGDEMRFVPVYKAPAEGRKHVQAAANPSSGMTKPSYARSTRFVKIHKMIRVTLGAKAASKASRHPTVAPLARRSVHDRSL
jgi:hypothetical protein